MRMAHAWLQRDSRRVNFRCRTNGHGNAHREMRGFPQVSGLFVYRTTKHSRCVSRIRMHPGDSWDSCPNALCFCALEGADWLDKQSEQLEYGSSDDVHQQQPSKEEHYVQYQRLSWATGTYLCGLAIGVGTKRSDVIEQRCSDSATYQT